MRWPKKLCGNALYFCVVLCLYMYVTYPSKNKQSLYGKMIPAFRQEATVKHEAFENAHPYQDWKELLKCQAYRQERLKAQCKALGLSKNLTFLNEADLQEIGVRFMVDELHQVILKSIPKTGCSSWKRIIMASQPDGEKYNDTWEHDWILLRRQMGLTTLDRHQRDEIIYRLQHYFTILTVRHPLERLESFFKNKKIDVDGIADQDPEGKELFMEKKIGEVFEKELNWIMSQPVKTLNQHVAPYTTKLAMECIIPFRFISKTETAEAEMEYVIKKYLSGKGKPLKVNTSSNVTALNLSPRDDGGVFLPVFSKLPDPQKTINELLEKVVGEDMKIFGYGVKVENNKVIATCESYKEFGYCC